MPRRLAGGRRGRDSQQPLICNTLIIIDLLRISQVQSPHYIPLFEKEIHWTLQDVDGQVSQVSILSLGVRVCRVEWQAARAANWRSLVARTLQACRSWPNRELWAASSPPGFAVCDAGFFAGSTALPQAEFRRERQ